jgi:hypothetical protein
MLHSSAHALKRLTTHQAQALPEFMDEAAAHMTSGSALSGETRQGVRMSARAAACM